jgi:hypothetical protein
MGVLDLLVRDLGLAQVLVLDRDRLVYRIRLFYLLYSRGAGAGLLICCRYDKMIMTLHMLCSILHVLSICFSVQRNHLRFQNAADIANEETDCTDDIAAHYPSDQVVYSYMRCII